MKILVAKLRCGHKLALDPRLLTAIRLLMNERLHNRKYKRQCGTVKKSNTNKYTEKSKLCIENRFNK